MKLKIGLVTLSLITSVSVSCQSHDIHTFLPQLVSTDQIEYYLTFSPENDQLHFVRRDAKWGDFKDKTPGHIYKSEKIHGVWQSPTLATFSGIYSDGAPFISSDGRYFFFTSNRPYKGKKGTGSDIWLMTKQEDDWSAPTPLNHSINSSGTEYSPVLTKSGRLYFASTRAGGPGQGDVYVCDFNSHGCDNLQNLGPDINTPTGEWNVFVDPMETFMIFEASGRIAGRDYGDLYISIYKNGKWQPAMYLTELNSDGSDLAARLSTDGQTLYFAQSLGGDVDIRFVDIAIIEKYR